MTGMIGTIVAGYELQRKLGEGATGESYLAIHQGTGRRVCVKVFRAAFSSDRRLLDRFFARVKAASMVNHAGIPAPYDPGVHTNGRAYLVMELLEGKTLADSLAEPDAAMHVDLLADIGSQLSDLLSAVHGDGLLHGALKPESIFLTFPASQPPRPLVKLLDFGMAMFSLDVRQSQTGSLLGAPLYMAPEIARGIDNCDHRSDIYSLGCILFEMACGRPPFAREGKAELIIAHAIEMAPPVSSLEPSIPPILDRLIGQMLTKNPAARPQSMAEVTSVLERLLKHPAPTERLADPTLPEPGLSAARPVPSTALLPPTPTSAVPPTQGLPTPAPGPTSAAMGAQRQTPTAIPPPHTAEKQSGGSLVGAVLEGAYRIDRLLGEGGMGAVYQATHLRLGRQVAIKVMARALVENREALERFRREARITSALGHPHIVQVFDFSTTPSGDPFMVMEFLEGEDLSHRLRRVGKVPLARMIHIVRQIASALSTTHAKDIVHRDLKPANIYLLDVSSEKDFVKVLDFGISKVRAATTKLTQASAIMGTPQYMSPEQALGKVDQIDARTDQWALACIAWECLSGQSPFIGDSVPSLLFQVVHESPEPLATTVGGLSPNVEDVLRRALSKDKQKRFPDIEQFVASLERASEGRSAPVVRLPVAETLEFSDEHAGDDHSASRLPPSTLRQAAGEVQSDEPTPVLRRRGKRLWPLAAILVLVPGGLAAVLLLKPPTPTPAAAPGAKEMLASAGIKLVTPTDGESIAIQAADLRALDPAELIRQAHSEACRRRPDCALTYSYIGGVRAGLLDTTADSANVLINIAYRATDPTKVPGEDVLDSGFAVRVREGKMYLQDGFPSSRPEPVWPDPQCSFVRAWQSAVRSGTPGNAVADVYYRDGHGPRARSRLVWYIRVQSHLEWSRQVDATTCEVLD